MKTAVNKKNSTMMSEGRYYERFLPIILKNLPKGASCKMKTEGSAKGE